MNSNLKQKFFTGAMVFLVTVFFIPAFAGAFTPGDCKPEKGFDRKGHHRSALGIWRNPQIVQKLGLTSEQAKKVRDAHFAFGEKRLVLKAELDSLRLQMDKAFSNDVIDNAAVLSLAQKISDIKGKMFVQNIESRLALGKLLNADQIKKLKLHDMHQKRKGPRKGKKHIFGQRSVERPDLISLSNDLKE